MASTRADAVRKVKALRALAAPGSGATDAERATASALADKLVKLHSLEKPDAPARRPGVSIHLDGIEAINVLFDFGDIDSFNIQSNHWNTTTR